MSEELNTIRRIIAEETIFLRHYIGEVLDVRDKLKQGRVQVSIAELGWTGRDTAPWCFPRFIQGVRIPAVGDWVEVYFINAKSNRPVWLGQAGEYKDTKLEALTSEKIDVMHESRTTGDAAVYDSENELYQFCDGSESFVKGDTTKDELQKIVDALAQLSTDLTSWTPVPNDGGSALKVIVSAGFLTKPAANLSNILSDKIKGQ